MLAAPANSIAAFGRLLIERTTGFGRFTRFTWSALCGLVSVRTWSRRDRLAGQLFSIGTMSVPALVVTGAFVGMILALEGYLQFASIGQEGRLGGVINLSIAKQLGPVLAAVILAGRVGCALTAELGSMRVTEQLDAMSAMASDPIRVLVCPRLIACIIMIPPLTIISNVFGVFGGWLVTTQFYGANADQYWNYSAAFISWFDVFNGLVKSVFFGAAIGLIACYKGFTCPPGATGVGRATTDSFVTSFLTIIAMNLVLAKALNDLDLWRMGGQVQSVFG